MEKFAAFLWNSSLRIESGKASKWGSEGARTHAHYVPNGAVHYAPNLGWKSKISISSLNFSTFHWNIEAKKFQVPPLFSWDKGKNTLRPYKIVFGKKSPWNILETWTLPLTKSWPRPFPFPVELRKPSKWGTEGTSMHMHICYVIGS